MPTKDRFTAAISLADQVLDREKKAETARANGAKSRGPKPEEGKAKSSQNALKHGLTAAKHLRLPDDEENAYEEFKDRMLTALNPEGDLQQYFAERAVDCMWRLRRIPALEANLLHAEDKPSHTKRLCYSFSHTDWPLAHLHICRYEATLERALKTALAELRKLQNEPNDLHNATTSEEKIDQHVPSPVPGGGIGRGLAGNKFGTKLRHLAGIHELQNEPMNSRPKVTSKRTPLLVPPPSRERRR